MIFQKHNTKPISRLTKLNGKIQWTGGTRWNPMTGCTKISPGCKNCYAETLAKKLQKEGNPRYGNGFDLTLHRDKIKVPYGWRSKQVVFMKSMSDLFHPDVPLEFIQEVFEVMNNCPQHQFQILTKRSERVADLASSLKWTPNIWMGVSVENREYVYRIDDLRTVPANIKFISAEPLIRPLPNLNLDGIHWCIIGGENPFPKSRKCELPWIEEIVAQCHKQGTQPFVKQFGDQLGKQMGMTGYRAKEGDDYSKFPKHLRTWELPMDLTPYEHCFV
jgi:protein gp37